MSKTLLKIGVFATHPIQYQVPLWQGLSASDDLQFKVYYFSDQGVSGGIDPGFGHAVTWDLPLLEGYSSEFLSKGDIQNINSFTIPDPDVLLENGRFDVVILHGYTHRFARQIIRNKRKYGYKVILRGEFTEMPRRKPNLHAYIKGKLRRIYLRWFYQYVDQFCPIGQDAIDHLVRFGIPSSQVSFSPYSVDDTLIKNCRIRLDRGAMRASFNISEKDLVIIFSGKMIPRKQPLLLVDALIGARQKFSNIFPIFVGSGDLYNEVCQSLSRAFGGRFIAPGFVNQTELAKYFVASDIFVLPSTYDTWGLVVNEAMHYGLPCIVSDKVGSRRDLLSPGITGEIFSHDSALELQNAIEKFAADPGRIQNMKPSVEETIQKYTIEETLKGLKNAIYSSMR